ncbi:MAG: uracil phosphoribosyltransferase [Sphaerochaetaceae bacterium]|jgi:uracil phosphoribosyltransferase|nr:uracil phosphoribosyltransferase [Sphaerochaetaceae bacterium]
MNTVTIKASDLDGYLTSEDKAALDEVDRLYDESIKCCMAIDKSAKASAQRRKAEEDLVASANKIGDFLKQASNASGRIHVYSFETPQQQHGQASRLVAKLRDPATCHEEFLYYIQRAYELLFGHVFADAALPQKRSIIVKTPVNIPVQNYAVHRIPDVDSLTRDCVMCVMLRGALLPSMIISKEIQDYSCDNYVTPFALFKIKRDESKNEDNMNYILNLDRSYFDFEALDNKDWIFADPMNATGGSLVTIVNYLKSKGIRPRSVKFINVISALKGSLRIIRAIDNCDVYTLWMDPVLNSKAYILPGLGDAGDRLNGIDLPDNPRNMIQLIADYGSQINNLYRTQVKKIEETVLG